MRLTISIVLLALTMFPETSDAAISADLVIYGSSPAAVTAAIKATDMGLKAVIVSPERHIGGLTASGLGFTDSGNTSAIGGLARDFYRRIYRAYQDPAAWKWQKMSDFNASGQGTDVMDHREGVMWTFEPHVAERVFEEWLAERKVVVCRGEFLDRLKGVIMNDGRIVSITTLSGAVYTGRYFIDATYEGDLMAAAGVPYRVGREDCAEYGEKWNGNQVGILHHEHHFRNWKISPYRIPGNPESGYCPEVGRSEPGVRGKGDRRVQAYCYRLCMTDEARNRIPFVKPDGYDPDRYEILRRIYSQGFDETFWKFDRIANHKTDTNNHGPMNADYIGGSDEWPEATYERRSQLARAHRDYQMGLYYFLSTDAAVPEGVRKEMSKWGLSKDEFVDNGGWPYSIYVREGRRMVGEYVMTEHDCLGEARHAAQGHAYGPVGMGSYLLDSHNVRRYVTKDGFVQNEGDIGVHPSGPYGIDYGAIIPKRRDCRNLLVPVAVSATHSSFGSIRMEPVFMILGESAATAAALAAREALAVQDVPYGVLAARLLADGQILGNDREVSADPFIGTAGLGHTTPAATVPFGMVQAGPDTSASRNKFNHDWAHCSGYQHGDPFVWRFSQTHLSGTGMVGLGDIGILPFCEAFGTTLCGEKVAESERAQPGHYAVTFKDGIRTEIAADDHSALYRFTFPQGRRARILVDLDWHAAEFSLPGTDLYGVFTCFVRDWVFNENERGCYNGTVKLTQGFDRDVHFALAFSRPPKKMERVTCPAKHHAPSYVADFGVPENGVVELRIALSRTSSAAAERNLDTEVGGRTFDEVRASAAEKWRRILGRVRLSSDTPEVTRIAFGSSLYRLFFQPNSIGDVDGNEDYSTFSLWDTFRAAHPLYTILAPERVDGMVRSMIQSWKRDGHLPVWQLWGEETHCMIGKHAVPVIADAYLKGFRGFDAHEAFAAVVETLTKEHRAKSVSFWGMMKEDWPLIDKYGYLPFDGMTGMSQGYKVLGESVSRLLECSYDNACAARFAAALGEQEKAVFFSKRADNWKNVFDTSIGCVRGRDVEGRWREPFDPMKCGHCWYQDNDFTEGNALQYTWHVMQDYEGLVAALGGQEKALEKLNALFKADSRAYGENNACDVTGLIGQYAHGNEPSHHIIYFFTLLGHPETAGKYIRQVFETQYSPRPNGLCGNDDCGQMAAWYVFSALGFYPFDPCGGEYVIGAPQVPGAILILPGDKTLKIEVKNFTKDNTSVKFAIFNGHQVRDFKLRHADLMKGGVLTYVMGR